MTAKQLKEKCCRYGFPDNTSERGDLIFRLQELETLNNSMLDGDVTGLGYKTMNQLVDEVLRKERAIKRHNAASNKAKGALCKTFGLGTAGGAAAPVGAMKGNTSGGIVEDRDEWLAICERARETLSKEYRDRLDERQLQYRMSGRTAGARVDDGDAADHTETGTMGGEGPGRPATSQHPQRQMLSPPLAPPRVGTQTTGSSAELLSRGVSGGPAAEENGAGRAPASAGMSTQRTTQRSVRSSEEIAEDEIRSLQREMSGKLDEFCINAHADLCTQQQ